MEHLAVILAVFMATLVVRKLVPGLVARGVRPFACDLCSASWGTLGFRWLWALYVDDGLLWWGVSAWVKWAIWTVACAGLTFILIRAYRIAEVRLGMPDIGAAPRPEDYQPPGGSL